jgi:CRISPR-associated protein Csx10
MKAITFSLTTQQPLLATSFQGDPNSDVSYSHIPGSMIRGAIIGRYMKKNQLNNFNLEKKIVRDLFFEDESVQYLNAYLESKDSGKRRTLPVPISWIKDKDKDLPKYESSCRMPIYDRATTDDLPEDLTPKSVQQRFCTVSEQSVCLYKENRRINIHNQRDRSKGRSTKEQGEIFRYDAIDVGQTFQPVILCETDEIYDEILRLLKAKDDIWLGGSQSAGYGHCKISNVQTRDDKWTEVSIPVAKRTSQDDLVITLLSNAILRDEYGQPVADPNLVKCEIEKILEIVNLPKPLPEAQPIYAGSENIGGFNRKWGLPLPQVPALSMGSVFVFKEYSLTEEQIKLLESQGIGERRVDGFGRIAVNWLSESEFKASSPKQVILLEPKSSMDVASQKIASDMTQRILRQNLDALLIKELSSKKLKGDISNSQLSKLRLVSRQAIAARNDFSLVKSMLDNLPPNSKKKFEQIKIGSKSFRDQIEAWLNDPKSWIVSPQDLLVKIRDIEAKLVEPLSSNPLAKEYTLRLIEALAKKATKEEK